MFNNNIPPTLRLVRRNCWIIILNNYERNTNDETVTEQMVLKLRINGGFRTGIVIESVSF